MRSWVQVRKQQWVGLDVKVGREGSGHQKRKAGTMRTQVGFRCAPWPGGACSTYQQRA